MEAREAYLKEKTPENGFEDEEEVAKVKEYWMHYLR